MSGVYERPISPAFWVQRENVLAEHLVLARRTGDESRNKYEFPVPRSKVTWVGSQGISPAHQGNLCNSVDIYVPEGTLVSSAADGVVVNVSDGFSAHGISTDFWAKGNRVDIRHKHDEYTAYEHLAPGIRVKVGDKVRKGQVIALSGNTGFSENPHLHFEAYRWFGPGPDDYETLKVRFSDFEDVYKSVRRLR